MISTLIPLAVMFAFAATGHAAAQPRRQTPKGPPKLYTATLPIEQMKNKQAVVETSAGAIVIDLLPEAAPDHVGYVMKLAAEGAYDGTTFHRVLRHGLIQGGDPVTRDPAKRSLYGTGGLGMLKFRANDLKHTRGMVSAVLRPGQPDTAGSQFFICISDQPALDGQFTVFGRVVEGLDVAQKIFGRARGRHASLATDRIEIPVDDDPGHAAARADAVRSRDAGRARALAGRARHDDGAGVDRVLPRPCAGARPQFPAAREARCLRRHIVPPRRPRLRRADGLDEQPARAAVAEAAGRDREPAARVQRHEARAGHPVDGEGRRPVERADPSFFICLGQAPSLDNRSTRSSAGSPMGSA